MIAGIELNTVDVTFQGKGFTADQASHESIVSAQKLTLDHQFTNGQCLVLLRRNVENALTVEVDPSPNAYIKALNKTGLSAQGALIYYGDDFTYLGNDCGYELTHMIDTDRSLENVAGVVVGLIRNNESTPYTWVFVDRQQLDAAINYQIAEVFGGVVQSERTIKGLMLNVAIRFMMKWQMDSQFPFPVDFSHYNALVELHQDLVAKCQKERRPRSTGPAYSTRQYRSVKNHPSSVEALMGELASPEAASDTILKTFNPMKPVIPEVDFNEFGV